MNERVDIDKSYGAAFVVDRSKLTRLFDLCDQRFSELGGEARYSLETGLKNGTHVVVTSIDQLLAQDNTIRNPIVSLKISIGTTRDATSRAHIGIAFDNHHYENVKISVTGETPKWTSQAFAEIEEQVERTFQRGIIHRVKSLGYLGIGAILIAVSSLMSIPLNPWLRASSVHPDPALLQLADRARTDSEKLHVVFTFIATALRQTQESQDVFPALSGWRLVFLLAPIVLLLGVTWYLWRHCYPRAIFCWGDAEEHYESLVARRKTLWSVVVIALIVGVLGNLFAASLPSFR